MDGTRELVERQIREAMEQGAFEDLPGKGRPIEFEPGNPFEERLSGVLQRILRDNGCSHPSIEAVREIDHEAEEMRARLRLARTAYLRHRDAALWERACQQFRADAGQFNRRLIMHNLQAPVVHFRRFRMDVEAEIRAAEEAV